MLGIVFHGRGQVEDVAVYGGNGHLSGRDRSGLIHDDGIDLPRRFQDLRAFNDKPQLCPAAGADEDCGGRRQAHSARAGHNEDGDRGNKRWGHPAEEEMGKECQHCYGHDRGDEDLRNAVHEALYRRLGRLCIRDQLGHLGQYRILAHLGRSDLELAGGINGCAGHRIAGPDLDGHGLAGDHGGVDRRVAGNDDAIGGDLFARAYYEDIAYLQLGNGNALLASLAQHRGFFSA